MRVGTMFFLLLSFCCCCSSVTDYFEGSSVVCADHQVSLPFLSPPLPVRTMSDAKGREGEYKEGGRVPSAAALREIEAQNVTNSILSRLTHLEAELEEMQRSNYVAVSRTSPPLAFGSGSRSAQRKSQKSPGSSAASAASAGESSDSESQFPGDYRGSTGDDDEDMESPAKRSKTFWNDEESDALTAGVYDQGVGNWKKILEWDAGASGVLLNKTEGQCKDRWRTLTRLKEKAEKAGKA